MYSGRQKDKYQELPVPVIRSGIYRDVPYQVGIVPRQVSQSEFQNSHYTGYICVKRLFDNITGLEYDSDRLSQKSFHGPPRIPSNISFGPSEDGWIGIGTMRSEVFNYSCSYRPFKRDTRVETADEGIYQEIWEVTADDIEQILKDWIDELYADHETSRT